MAYDGPVAFAEQMQSSLHCFWVCTSHLQLQVHARCLLVCWPVLWQLQILQVVSQFHISVSIHGRGDSPGLPLMVYFDIHDINITKAFHRKVSSLLRVKICQPQRFYVTCCLWGHETVRENFLARTAYTWILKICDQPFIFATMHFVYTLQEQRLLLVASLLDASSLAKSKCFT